MVDPFAVLGLERAFDVDLAKAEKTHRELSRALHPDRFASSGKAERRIALAKAVEVNEAWRTVRDPVTRAEALFTLADIAVGDGKEPKPTQALLVDMLVHREDLAEARAKRDARKVAAMAATIQGRFDAACAALALGFRAGPDASLVQKLGELRFYKRFLDEVSDIEDGLANGAA